MVVLLAAGLSLSLAGPALGAAAKKGTYEFKPGIDLSSWYWQRQQDQEVTTPPGVTLPPPAPPVSQRARLPNPQRPDTIPVAINNSETERSAAIKFDVTERGVTEGSEIKKFVLTIQESTDRNENPSFRPDAAKIQACRITESLVAGENEEMADAPKFDEADCIEGARTAAPAAAPGQTAQPSTWTFDLSPIAEPWGKNPFENNGVMLLPVDQNGGPQETWQVNLKVPMQDDPATPADDYEQTKNRAVLELEFVPGEPLELEVASTEGTTTATDGTGTGASTVGGTTAGSPPLGSTDLTGASGSIPGSDTTPVTAPPVPTGITPTSDQEPRLPAYVWLAVPLGLLALSAVRSVVLEPAGGPRPDGVIASIRRRNAERRGGATSQAAGVFTRLTGAFRRGASGPGKAVSTIAKSVRRKS
ncbi:MAG: hypothetical protein ACRDJP_12130 [Actinomycetota bacterium]